MPPSSSPAALPALTLLTLLASACTRRVEVPGAAPVADPSAEWAALLKDAASPDGLDYDHVDAHREVLERYLAWVGEHGEQTDEWKESKEDRRIAHLVNAYNAAVIYGVLQHRPLQSVREVKVGPYRAGGAGFFVGLRFRVDSEWVSLHDLEVQRTVNRYQEPLVHVALNCASRSCPPLRWWKEQGLQGQLMAAMRRFVASDRGLQPVGGTAEAPDSYAASRIFEWYADDFTDWSQASTVCEWLVDYASGEKKAWLERHAQDCPLQWQEWDWTLNEAPRLPEGSPSDEEPDLEGEGKQEAPGEDEEE